MLERGEYGQGFPVRFSQGLPEESGMGWMFSMTRDEIKPYQPLEFEPRDAGAFGPLAEVPEKARSQNEVPDSFEEFDDSWIGVPVFDQEYERPFAYQKREVDFCKKYGIAPYDTHFMNRFWRAQKEMNLIIPVETECGGCSKPITVSKNFTYSDRKIYCHDCYLKYLEQHG